MLAKNRDAHRLTGPCEDAHKGSQPDHVPAIEASRRASALTGLTFLKHQGMLVMQVPQPVALWNLQHQPTLMLKELSNRSKERKSCLRDGARDIWHTRPNCQRASRPRGSGRAPVPPGRRKDLGLSVAQLASGLCVM